MLKINKNFLIMDFKHDQPIGYQIDKRASELGLSGSELCRRANIPRDTYARYKRSDNLTIKNIKAMVKALDEREIELNNQQNDK